MTILKLLCKFIDREIGCFSTIKASKPISHHENVLHTFLNNLKRQKNSLLIATLPHSHPS